MAEFKKLTGGMAAAGPAAILNTSVINRLDILEAHLFEGKAHQDKESEKLFRELGGTIERVSGVELECRKLWAHAVQQGVSPTPQHTDGPTAKGAQPDPWSEWHAKYGGGGGGAAAQANAPRAQQGQRRATSPEPTTK